MTDVFDITVPIHDGTDMIDFLFEKLPTRQQAIEALTKALEMEMGDEERACVLSAIESLKACPTFDTMTPDGGTHFVEGFDELKRAPLIVAARRHVYSL